MSKKYRTILVSILILLVCCGKNSFSSEKKIRKLPSKKKLQQNNRLRRSRSSGAIKRPKQNISINILAEKSQSPQISHSALVKKIKKNYFTWDYSLLIACSESNVKDYTAALQNGADPNYYYEGQTPLHIACQAENLDLVALLLNDGANLNIQNKQGQTPLYIACKKENFDIASLLLDNGAQIDIKNKRGKTPVDIAIKSGNDAIINLFSDYDSLTHNSSMLSPRNMLYKFTNSSEGSPNTRTNEKKFIRFVKKARFEKTTLISQKYTFFWEKEVLSKALNDKTITEETKNSYIKYALKVALNCYALSNFGLNKTQRALEYIKHGAIWHSERKQIIPNLHDIAMLQRDFNYNIMHYLLTHNFTNKIILSILKTGLQEHSELVLEGLTEDIFFKAKNSNNLTLMTPLKWILRKKLPFLKKITEYIEKYCDQETIETYFDQTLIVLLWPT